MVSEAFIAHQKKMIDNGLLAEIEEYVFAVYGNARLMEEDVEPILALTLQDKKNRGREVRMSLLNGPGSCAFDVPVTAAEMRRALAYYNG
jgi:3-dehydroquinate synthase